LNYNLSIGKGGKMTGTLNNRIEVRLKNFFIKYFLITLLVWVFIKTHLASGENTELTIYNQDFYFVKETREKTINNAGLNRIEVTNVPYGIEERSIKFKSLTDPDARIIEQNFHYDLISEGKIWYKLLNKKIRIRTTDSALYEGYLIGGPRCTPSYSYEYYGGGAERKRIYNYTVNNLLLVKDPNKGPIISIPIKDVMELPELPTNLVITPTLYWLIQSYKIGRHKISLSYVASGIDWSCDYNLLIDEKDEMVDLSGWITIDNHSGVEYEDAQVSLIAGDIHKIKEQYGAGEVLQTVTMRSGLGDITTERQFLERPIFEYHQYDLQRPVKLLDNETKQIEFLNVPLIRVKKLYYYDGARFSQSSYMNCRASEYYEAPCNKKVNVFLQFANTQTNNLGIPLPKGKVRVYKKDKEGRSHFIGEDLIDHTPKDEKIKIYIGDAFDVVGTRIRTKFMKISEDVFPTGKRNNAPYIYDESFQITIKNHKNTGVEVTVFERMYRWSEWRIVESSHNYIQKDDRTVEFPVEVAPNSEAVLTYT